MIKSLFLIFMLVLNSSTPFYSVHGQESRDTIIHSAIDGDNNPVPKRKYHYVTSITFNYSEPIKIQPTTG